MTGRENRQEPSLEELALRQQVQDLAPEEPCRQQSLVVRPQETPELSCGSVLEQLRPIKPSWPALDSLNSESDRPLLLEKLLEMSPGLLYLLDVIDQRPIYINARSLDLLGYPPATVLARGADFMTQQMHPDDLARQPAYFERLASSPDGSFCEREYRIRHASGEWRWLSSRDRVFSRTAAGTVQQIFGMAEDITHRKQAEQRRDIHYAIARVLAEATTVAEALPAILQGLCEALGWQFGVIWRVNDSTNCLQYADSWRSPTTPAQALKQSSRDLTFTPGVGLPGRVWAQRQALWIADLTQDHNFPRAAGAEQAGLKAALGFPIVLGNSVLGVIECFCDRTQEPDADLLNMMAAIGSQIGQFMERKRTEAALQESQALFQSFMNHSPISAFIKDATGRHLYVNSSVAQFLGRSQAEVIGKTDFELFPPEAAQQWRENDLAVLARGEVLQMVETIHQEDGDQAYLSFKFPFRNAAGAQLLAGVAINITERIQAEAALQQREAELRLVTNAVPVLISFVDVDQRYRFNNQRYEEWFERPMSEVNGKYLWEVLGEAAYATIRPYVEQVLAGHQVTFENTVPYKQGGSRHVMATYVPRFDSQGKVEGFVALVNDITAQKQAARTIRQNEERLRIAQQAANAGVWDWDILTNQVTWSDEYYRLYGLDPAVILPSYENWLGSIVESDRDRVDQAARAALEHQRDLNVEFRIVHPSRGERWLTAIGQTFLNQHGQPKRMTGIALDITDRKQAEIALRESEARYQVIAQNVPGMIYRYTPRPDGSDGFTYVSSGSRELLELEPEAIVRDSTTVWRLFHPDDLPSLQASVAIAVKNSLPWQWEGRLITPSGQLKWIQGKSRPEATESGIVWDGLLIDITERKQAEQALRESEEWARLAIQIGQLGAWRLHLDSNLVEIDRRMREIWGEPDDAVLISLARVLERIHPEDRSRVAAAVSAAIDPQSPGIYEIEYRLIWNDSSVRWVSAKGQAQFEGEGASRRTVDFFGTSLDITERKQAEAALRQSEERYRYLAESIPQLVWTADATGLLLDVNQRWSTFTGLTLAQAQTGGWAAVVHPDDLSRMREQWTIAEQTGSNYQAEGRMRRADGEYRWHLHQAVPMKDAAGQVSRWFGTATDIEDQKQLEQQRIHLFAQEQAAREEAEAANRIKDEFLAVLSHELRSPLNPILGWAKLLQLRSLDAQATQQALQTIERNAKLQAQLIEDLLDVSRILRGKMSLNIGPVNLATVVESALETVQLAAEAKQIRIQTVPSIEPFWVSGDAARLQQMVWNLLSNAVKFTPEGGQIQVRFGLANHWVQLQVQDTGKGIDPAFLPYVFDYFRQENSTTTRKFGGLGLGLAIARHLTELHGGTVEAESPGAGQGATFTIQLPLMSADLTFKQPPTEQAQAIDLSQLRILIVDDEADMRELGQFILEQQGAQVRVAASAVEALQMFDRQPPDLLISDIGMPEFDGYRLIQQIRQRSAAQGGQVLAIALTAYAGEYNQRLALAAGFQQHLAKPVEPDRLIHTIASLLAQQGEST